MPRLACCLPSSRGMRDSVVALAHSIHVAHVEYLVAIEEPSRLLGVAMADLGRSGGHLCLRVLAELENADLRVVAVTGPRVRRAQQAAKENAGKDAMTVDAVERFL